MFAFQNVTDITLNAKYSKLKFPQLFDTNSIHHHRYTTKLNFDTIFLISADHTCCMLIPYYLFIIKINITVIKIIINTF